jgi:hypothetical protein
MIQIRHDKSEIEIAGSTIDLRQVAQSIVNFLQHKSNCMTLSVRSDFDPAPYSNTLSSLIVEKGNGPMRVTIADDALKITGDPEFLKLLPSRFDHPESQGDGYHCHVDYFGQDWLAPDSLSLVVMVKRAI